MHSMTILIRFLDSLRSCSPRLRSMLFPTSLWRMPSKSVPRRLRSTRRSPGRSVLPVAHARPRQVASSSTPTGAGCTPQREKSSRSSLALSSSNLLQTAVTRTATPATSGTRPSALTRPPALRTALSTVRTTLALTVSPPPATSSSSTSSLRARRRTSALVSTSSLPNPSTRCSTP